MSRDPGDPGDPGDADDTSARATDQGKPTGAGAEAAEGTHNATQPRAPSQNSGVGAAADQPGDPDDGDRRGSEPLSGRTDEHVSGYGGAGGTPKESSDQRE